MAVLGMDQYAHLIASRLPGATLVSDAAAIADAVRSGRVPVLAPSSWLRRADPLPHSWSVTSDSIAAWVARAVGARDLLVIKPPHAAGADLVDPYFARDERGHPDRSDSGPRHRGAAAGYATVISMISRQKRRHSLQT